jgi:hypothetical protein
VAVSKDGLQYRFVIPGTRPALFVELHEGGLKKFGTSVSAILEHLSRYGYEAYWLMRTGPHRKANPEEIRSEVARNGYVDVLFLAAARGAAEPEV